MSGDAPVALDPGRALEAEGAHPLRHWLVVLGPWIALLFVLIAVGMRYAPLDAEPVDAPADTFSAGRALAHLDAIDPEGVPHPVGAPVSAAWIAAIADRMETLGLRVEHQRDYVCGRFRTCAVAHNLLARIPGNGNAVGAVLLMAHHDSVVSAPGAGDDGHGIGVILELARIALTEDLDRDVIVLFTDAEETGLLGAELFATLHPWAADVAFVINLEARGTDGPSVLFETTGRTDALIARFGAAAARPITTSLAEPVYDAMPNDTDLSIFDGRIGPSGAAVIGANLAFVGGGARYHTPLDDRTHLDPGTVQHQGDHALALLRTMASAEVDPIDLEAAPNQIYFDVWGFGVVSWSVASALPLAGVAAGLVLLALIGALLRRVTRLREVLAAALLWWLTLPALAGALYGVGTLLVALGALPNFVPWPAHPAPVFLLGFGVALVFAALPVAVLWKRLGVWAWWMGPWLGFAALSVLSAAVLPAASYLVGLPTLLAGLVASVLAWTPLLRRPWARVAFAVLPLLGAASLCFPVAWLLVDGIGLGPLNPTMILIGLALTCAWPLVRQQSRRWSVPAVAGVCIAVGFVGATALPTYSTSSPMRLNVLHHAHFTENPDRSLDQTARWQAMTLGDPLPDDLESAADWSDEPEAMLPWARSLRAVYTAPAPRLEVEPPYLSVVALEPLDETGVRRAEIQISSARGARFVALRWSGERVVHWSVEGWTYAAGERPWQGFDSYASDDDAIDVTLWIVGAEPLPVWVVDKSYGAPPEAAPLLEALPEYAAQTQDGHAQLVSRETTVPAH